MILVLSLAGICYCITPDRLHSKLSDYKTSPLKTSSINNKVIFSVNSLAESKENFKTILNTREGTSDLDTEKYKKISKRQIPGTEDTKMMIGTFQAMIRPMTAGGNILNTNKNSQNTTENDVE